MYILQFILVISIVLWFMQILFAFVTREPWRCYILFKYLTSKQSVKTSAHTHKYDVLSMYKISSCNNNGLKKVKQFLHNTINADVYWKTFTYNGTLMWKTHYQIKSSFNTIFGTFIRILLAQRFFFKKCSFKCEISTFPSSFH